MTTKPMAETIEDVVERLTRENASLRDGQNVEWMRSEDIDRLQSAEAQRDKLAAEVGRLTAECALGDMRVSYDELMAQHRASLVELRSAEAKFSALVGAFKITLEWATYETEYDGRTYEICQSCAGQDGEHRPHCKVGTYQELLASLDRTVPAEEVDIDAEDTRVLSTEALGEAVSVHGRGVPLGSAALPAEGGGKAVQEPLHDVMFARTIISSSTWSDADKQRVREALDRVDAALLAAFQSRQEGE